MFGGIKYDTYGMGYLVAIHLAVFAALYTVVANAFYIWAGLNGKLKTAGASVAHLGFGLMLVGILISSSKKTVLSYNTTGINLKFDPNSKEKTMENITLVKSIRTDMGAYHATYINSDSTNESGTIMYFKINMKKKDSTHEFTLYPNLIRNTKGAEGFSNNPDSKHYWNRDIFSYISYADNMDKSTDTTSFRSYSVDINDTIFYSNGFIKVNRVVPNPSNERYKFTSSDTALMADLTVTTKEGLTYPAMPVFFVKNNQAKFVVDTIFAQNMAIGFSRVLNNRKIEIQVKESKKLVPSWPLKYTNFHLSTFYGWVFL